MRIRKKKPTTPTVLLAFGEDVDYFRDKSCQDVDPYKGQFSMTNQIQKKPAKVGILIRTKNRNLFLDRAIKNILNQTFSDWHIYIINDGGEKTGFESVINKYSDVIGDRITTTICSISCGRGMSAALLLGICSEEYLIIHDDDDTLEPGFLERTVAFLDNDTENVFSGVTTSNYDVIEHVEGNGIVIDDRIDTMGFKAGNVVDYGLYLARAFIIIPISFLFRRRSAKLSGTVKPDMDFMEDYDFFLRILQTGEIGVIPDFLCSYHQRKPVGSNQDMSRDEKTFDRETVYRNNLIRNAITGKDNTSHIQALLIQNKNINELTLHRISGIMQQISNAYIETTKYMMQMDAKINKILSER